MHHYTVVHTFLTCWTAYFVCNWVLEDHGRSPAGARETPKGIASRCVAMCHGVYVAYEATIMWWTWGDQTDSGWLLSVALGYFLWDLVFSSVYYDSCGRDMVLHAAVCAIGYCVALMPFMQYQAVALLMFEWSTPFLHGTHIARNYRFVVTSVALFGIFVVLFVVFRVLWGSYFILGHVVPLVWQQRHENHWALTAWTMFGTLTSECLNLYWFKKIVRKLKGIK